MLGKLKLPGFSNYLHPYDDNHIMGFGRDTRVNVNGGVETLGIKLVMFDVTDIGHPSIVDIFQAGDGTDSEILTDHKALLFDRNKNILSIPVTANNPGLASPSPSSSSSPPIDGVTESNEMLDRGIWKGFFVFGINPEKGFDLKTKIEHFTSDYNNYYYKGISSMYGESRSFIINNELYTVSTDNLIKINDLQNFSEVNKLPIGSDGKFVIRYLQTPTNNGTAAEK